MLPGFNLLCRSWFISFFAFLLMSCDGAQLSDPTSTMVLLKKYDTVQASHEWGRIVSKDGLLGVIDPQGGELFAPQFDKIAGFKQSGVSIVRKDKKFGLIATDGRMLLPVEYESVSPFNASGFSIIAKDEPNQERYYGKTKRMHGLIDTQGHIVVDVKYDHIAQYPHDLLLVREGHRKDPNALYGLLTRSGSWLVEPRFNRIGKFKDNLAIVSENKKFGFINNLGEVTIALAYDDVEDFSEGLARVTLDNRSGFIDPSGEVVIALGDYSASSFDGGLSIIRMLNTSQYDRRYGLMDKTGQQLTGFRFKQIKPFHDGLAVAIDRKTKLAGMIDKKGEYVIAPQYLDMQPFSNGFSSVTYRYKEAGKLTNTQFLIDKNNRHFVDLSYRNLKALDFNHDAGVGIVSVNGERASEPVYQNAMAISPNQIMVKQKGLWGLVDDENNTVLPIRYSSIRKSEGHLFDVEINGKWGVVTNKNNIVLPLEFDEIPPHTFKKAKVRQGDKWSNISLIK